MINLFKKCIKTNIRFYSMEYAESFRSKDLESDYDSIINQLELGLKDEEQNSYTNNEEDYIFSDDEYQFNLLNQYQASYKDCIRIMCYSTALYLKHHKSRIIEMFKLSNSNSTRS